MHEQQQVPPLHSLLCAPVEMTGRGVLELQGQSPHPNFAKSAKLGWGTLALFLCPRGFLANGSSLSQRLVVEADDAGDLPHSVLVLPEMNELGLADGAGFLVSGVMEAVDADLDRAVVGNGIDLERAGNEFPGDFATDIVLDCLDESWASAAQAGLVVIELDIVGDQRSEFLQIAVVVGVEELGIQRLDGFEERVGEGAVWEWAKGVVSKAATRTACTRTVVFFIRGSFLREVCAPGVTCGRGRLFRDPCSCM